MTIEDFNLEARGKSLEALADVFDELKGAPIYSAYKATIKGAVRAGRTSAIKIFGREFPTIKRRDVAPKVTSIVKDVSAPNISSLAAAIRISKHEYSLNKLGAEQGAKGVTYFGQAGRSIFISSAFRATMPGGYKGFFVRDTKAHLPITRLVERDASPSKVMRAGSNITAMNKAIVESFNKNLAGRVEFYIAKAVKKVSK